MPASFSDDLTLFSESLIFSSDAWTASRLCVVQGPREVDGLGGRPLPRLSMSADEDVRGKAGEIVEFAHGLIGIRREKVGEQLRAV